MKFGINPGIIKVQVRKMDGYKEMYYRLFGKITDIIKELQSVQQETEEIFLSQETEKREGTCLAKKRSK
ncbi:MAG: hypothetical protein K0R90_1067 [Oscillospiraceae bacterium]|nr:hypothetical protein [Oscillospiraceae bacterium]